MENEVTRIIANPLKEITGQESVSIKEAANMLNVSVQRVSQLLKANRLSGVKIGIQWYVSPNSIARFSRLANAGRPRVKPTAGYVPIVECEPCGEGPK